MVEDLGRFIHPSKRYRLFFDETGTGDLRAVEKNPNQRYLNLTGIVIRQDIHDSYTTKRLTRLKSDIFGKGIGENIILHRREIVRKEGVFQILRSSQICGEFDSRLAAMICEIPSPAFTVSIDKLAHLKRYSVWHFSPYHYCLTCLLERFVLWLNRTNNFGDAIGEARGPTHDAQLRRAFRHFYEHGTKVRPAVIQHRLTSSELKLEAKAANISGLQLADMLAHPAHRSYRAAKMKEQAPNDHGSFLNGILERHIFDRKPLINVIEGYGRKWLP